MKKYEGNFQQRLLSIAFFSLFEDVLRDFNLLKTIDENSMKNKPLFFLQEYVFLYLYLY